MKNIIFFLILIISFNSCKSSKRVNNKTNNSVKVITKKIEITNTKKSNSSKSSNSKTSISKTDNIINYAKTFEGVPYKWGGTTKAGMDCSGLIFESFREHDIYLPRISRDIAKKGTKLSLKQVEKGDLLFFKTQNRRNAINHVGLIVAIKNNNIQFIHASSSKGVMTSWLNETYWLNAFVEARRIL